MLVSWNLPHRPEDDDLRVNQIRTTMSSYYRNTDPSDSPLYLHLMPRIRQELIDQGVEFLGTASPETEVWKLLASRDPFRRKGRKCNMNRFLGIVSHPEAHNAEWALDTFERTTVAISLDMLAGSALASRICVRADAARDAERVGPTTAAITVEDRTLRSCTQNAVTISVMMLSDLAHQRVVLSILATARQLKTGAGKCEQSFALDARMPKLDCGTSIGRLLRAFERGGGRADWSRHHDGARLLHGWRWRCWARH